MIGHLTTHPPSLRVHLVRWYKWLWKGEGLDRAIHVEGCIVRSSFSCTYTREGGREGEREGGREGRREGGKGGEESGKRREVEETE